MKVTDYKHTKTVTLEIDGTELAKFKGAWSTLEQLLRREDLTSSQQQSISTAMEVLGALV